MNYIDVRDCVKQGAKGARSATIQINGGREYGVQFTEQKTGCGEKTFFICPKCGGRRTKLYVLGGLLLCRHCCPIPIYRGIKNVTPGGYQYIEHRMVNLAEREGIRLKKGPFCYLEYEKPKYKHFEKWHLAITKLQALENMRNQAIFFSKRYSLETIRSVMEEKNLYLYVCTLQDLYQYFYDWDTGYRKFPGNKTGVKPSGVTSQMNSYQRDIWQRRV